ncbi:GDSL-type esterase/lipase family protein [Paenibacillus illinoisensis]|uniref:GDSL-type esterase/lipase family protein n=1 Tax=Paenibacillus illinoisensis TaxID=59845 RepID=UPI00301DF4E0
MSDLGTIAFKRAKALENKQGLLVNGSNGLARWRSALAKVSNGDLIANLNIIGSSSVVGVGSGGGGVAGNLAITQNSLVKSFPGRLRTKLAEKFGNVGRGFVPTHYDKFWTFTGAWAGLANYGIIGAQAKKSTTLGDSASFSFNGTSLTLVLVTGTFGAGFSVAIDGGAPQTFTSVGTATAAKEFVVATGLTDGAHTAVITITTVATATHGLTIVGAYEGKAATAGVRVNAIGVTGSKTSAALGENFLYAEIDMWNPALTVISYSSNDYASQTALETFRTQTQTLITRAKQFGDVLLFPAGTRVASLAIPLESYINVYRELADANGIAFVDSYTRWKADPSYAKNTLQFIASDDVHMNDYGHQDLADALYNALINY